MIVSMTGFGDASAERNGAHYSVEIRSLNNRYYKSVIKLPDPVSGLEPEIDTMLREKLGRGSITYILKMRMDSAEAAYRINVGALQMYIDQLREVRGLDAIARIDLASLAQLPGVCQEPAGSADSLEVHGETIRKLTNDAIEKLIAFRKREGKSLYEELMRHTKVMSTNLKDIATRAPFVIDEYHKRLSNRVQELLGRAELKVSEPDLMKEVAVFSERADISEEIQRLTHHIEAFEASCKSGEHAGRKLDFISQEMLREANTIASKANDAQIAGRIVEIKGAIDRVKEQVQNVE